MVKPLDSYVVCKIVTLREIGLSHKEIREKLGLKPRSTAQTAYQRFFEAELLCGEKTSRPAGKAQRKRARAEKTSSSKSGRRPKINIRTSKSTAKLFQRQKQSLDVLFKEP